MAGMEQLHSRRPEAFNDGLNTFLAIILFDAILALRSFDS
jgi:hypothetical protein